jgi:Ca-activated chloride channel family protein
MLFSTGMWRKCLIAVALSAVTAAAQMSESVSVGYVMIPFTAVGAKGIPLTDLKANEVSLMVDGQRVRSDIFEKATDAPVSFTILIDGSGSMALAGKMDAARAAIGALIAHRHSGDDFSLWVFGDAEAQQLVPFTAEPSAITNALGRIKPFGKTAFFDALAGMPERSRLGRNASRAIILLSDGIDNASRLTRPELAQRLEGVAVPIYPLGIRDPHEARATKREESSDLDILSEVALLTGGKMVVGNQPSQIAEAIADIEKHLRAQYLVGFTPTGRGAVQYRRISLLVDRRVRAVRVRAGYRGTEPPVAAQSLQKKGSS